MVWDLGKEPRGLPGAVTPLPDADTLTATAAPAAAGAAAGEAVDLLLALLRVVPLSSITWGFCRASTPGQHSLLLPLLLLLLSHGSRPSLNTPGGASTVHGVLHSILCY